MSRPVTPPGPVDPVDVETLSRTARWWADLGDALADMGRRVGRLSEQIGHDWPDGRGLEWAERVVRLGQELGREAGSAAELGEAYARQAADPVRLGLPSSRLPGMRLGGTAAQRADSERGMRIAQLPAENPETG
ncbi:hypothetical protein [Pseudonocardia alaniniphila]|uniref:Excreted virulence factor EspC (Type VII ESX diderm) n=1 Tax=Pseudonocardia alaniniphila TaxID=75291 RepID=A0ABS9TFF8_9PSEU|nr:hypothetical protein [Pseudonocardia alaniniphila]MCH6167237.1 hypothetical protein [Pseudonocardia alaniniphila]